MDTREAIRHVREQNFAVALRAAEELLQKQDALAPEQLAEIYTRVCECKVELTEYLAAMEVGEKALGVARQVGDPDLIAYALFQLAAACYHTRFYARAIALFTELLQQHGRLQSAAELIPKARRTIGFCYYKLRDYAQAIPHMLQAHEQFLDTGDLREADLCRTNLIPALLFAGQLELVPPLLDTCDEYAAQAAEAMGPMNAAYNRALYLYYTGNYPESVRCGLDALKRADGQLAWQSMVNLLLSKAARAQGDHKDALGFALAARMAALDGRRYDFEFEAAEVMMEIIRTAGPAVVSALADEFRRYGLDLFSYIPENRGLFRD